MQKRDPTRQRNDPKKPFSERATHVLSEINDPLVVKIDDGDERPPRNMLFTRPRCGQQNLWQGGWNERVRYALLSVYVYIRSPFAERKRKLEQKHTRLQERITRRERTRLDEIFPSVL